MEGCQPVSGAGARPRGRRTRRAAGRGARAVARAPPISRTLAELHRLPEAARYAEQAFARSKGTTNPWMAKGVLLTRAGIYREMGDVRRAEQMLAQVEPTIERSLTESAYMTRAASERALIAQGRGDLSAALSLMTRALTTVDANPHSSSVPRYLTRRSAILLDMGRFDDSRADAERAVAIEQKSGFAGPGTSGLGRAYLALGRVLHAERQHDAARAAFTSAIEHLTPSLGADHPETRLAKQMVSLPPPHQAASNRK